MGGGEESDEGGVLRGGSGLRTGKRIIGVEVGDGRIEGERQWDGAQ